MSSTVAPPRMRGPWLIVQPDSARGLDDVVVGEAHLTVVVTFGVFAVVDRSPQGVQFDELARVVLVWIDGVTVGVVEILEHRPRDCYAVDQLAEHAEGIGTDRVAVVRDQRVYDLEPLQVRDIEVVQPEVGHELAQLIAAVGVADKHRRDQLFHRTGLFGIRTAEQILLIGAPDFFGRRPQVFQRAVLIDRRPVLRVRCVGGVFDVHLARPQVRIERGVVAGRRGELFFDPGAPADAFDLVDDAVTRAEGHAVEGDLFLAGFVGKSHGRNVTDPY